MPTNRKLTPAQARKAALESGYTPIYAIAGLTEALATSLRASLATTQDKSAAQAKASAEELTSFVRSLPEQFKTLPDTTKARLSEWQQQAQVLVTEFNATYGDLAGRGKKLVDDTVINARILGGKAEDRAEDLRADAAEAADPAFEKVQETVTRARKTVTGHTATETVTPRSTAKATATRAAAKKTPAKKAPAKKAAAAKKAPAKKASAPAATNA